MFAQFFLKIVEITNGCAETIEAALMANLEEKSIPLSRLVGFGGDGASVMIGKHFGVATRLKNKQPILTSIHCMAHRLALATSQAGEKLGSSVIHSSSHCVNYFTLMTIAQLGLVA